MIVRFPDTPRVEGELRVPRPSVYLIGDYGQIDWNVHAARALDRHVGCVFFSDVAADLRTTLFQIRWALTWIEQVDVVGCWIETDTWDQFELGFILGRGLRLVAGCTVPDTASVLAQMMAVIGFDSVVYEDFDLWLTAVEMIAKS